MSNHAVTVSVKALAAPLKDGSINLFDKLMQQGAITEEMFAQHPELSMSYEQADDDEDDSGSSSFSSSSSSTYRGDKDNAISYVHTINEPYIEIAYLFEYAPDSIDGLSDSDFAVTVNGEKVAVAVDAYFDEMVTLKLAEPLEDPEDDNVHVYVTEFDRNYKA